MPIEAVAGVVVVVFGAAAEKNFLRSVEIQTCVPYQLVLSQSVVIVTGVIQRKIVEAEIAAVVDQHALAGRHVRIGLKPLIFLNLLQFVDAIRLLQRPGGRVARGDLSGGKGSSKQNQTSCRERSRHAESPKAKTPAPIPDRTSTKRRIPRGSGGCLLYNN